ncbi:MAG: hypothetical protein GY696_13145, partial [Gammaproteobacteria bacterium]|nr:hypothetical protein [Gammaproteobacteria bacterium]
DAESLRVGKELKLKDGTVLSEMPEPESWTIQIQWKMCAEMTKETLVETIMSMCERDCPQRITLVALQQYIGVLSIDEMKDMIDELVNQVQSTKHQLAIPTVRYVPHAISHWHQVREINAHKKCGVQCIPCNEPAP